MTTNHSNLPIAREDVMDTSDTELHNILDTCTMIDPDLKVFIEATLRHRHYQWMEDRGYDF